MVRTRETSVPIYDDKSISVMIFSPRDDIFKCSGFTLLIRIESLHIGDIIYYYRTSIKNSHCFQFREQKMRLQLSLYVILDGRDCFAEIAFRKVALPLPTA
jgi:hypothetical protein